MLSRHARRAPGGPHRRGVQPTAMGVTLDESAWTPHAHTTMSFLAMDPPEQTRLRKLVSKGFTPRRVAGLEAADPAHHRPLPRRSAWSARDGGGFDWITDLAGKIPMDVISEMLGVPEADRDEVRRLADLLVHREPGLRDVPAGRHRGRDGALRLLRRPARREAAAPGRRPHQRAARRRGRRRPDDRPRDHRVPLPDGRRRQRDHHQAARQRGLPPDRRPGAARPGLRRPDAALDTAWIEETLRYDTSTQLLARLLVEDLTLHGVTAPAGSQVLLALGAANHDERGLHRSRALRPRP